MDPYAVVAFAGHKVLAVNLIVFLIEQSEETGMHKKFCPTVGKD